MKDESKSQSQGPAFATRDLEVALDIGAHRVASIQHGDAGRVRRATALPPRRHQRCCNAAWEDNTNRGKRYLALYLLGTILIAHQVCMLTQDSRTILILRHWAFESRYVLVCSVYTN